MRFLLLCQERQTVFDERMGFVKKGDEINTGVFDAQLPRPADKTYRCLHCKITSAVVEGPLDDPRCIVCHRGGLEIVPQSKVSRTKGLGCR